MAQKAPSGLRYMGAAAQSGLPTREVPSNLKNGILRESRSATVVGVAEGELPGRHSVLADALSVIEVFDEQLHCGHALDAPSLDNRPFIALED